MINHPQVCIPEDGKQGKLDPAALGFKRRFDPQGLLDPRKMRRRPQPGGPAP